MRRIVPNPKFHPRDRRSPKHEQWRRRVVAGVRRARAQRRKQGLLTARDLAYESSFGLNSIYKLLDSGDLPFLRVGKRRYIRREDWDQWRHGTPGGQSAA